MHVDRQIDREEMGKGIGGGDGERELGRKWGKEMGEGNGGRRLGRREIEKRLALFFCPDMLFWMRQTRC